MPFPVRADEYDGLRATQTLDGRTAWFRERGGKDEQLFARWAGLFAPGR